MLKRNKTLGKEDGVKYLGDISWLRDSNTSYIVDRMYMNKFCQVITWNGPCVTVYILASLHTHLKRPCIYLPSASNFFNMTVIETNPTSPIIVWLIIPFFSSWSYGFLTFGDRSSSGTQNRSCYTILFKIDSQRTVQMKSLHKSWHYLVSTS